jgi:hypothetical protein
LTDAENQQVPVVDWQRGGGTIDVTTPVVEIEEPLLSAADVVDGLLEQTRVKFDMDGVNILLFSKCGDVEEVNVNNQVICSCSIENSSLCYVAEYQCLCKFRCGIILLFNL